MSKTTDIQKQINASRELSAQQESNSNKHLILANAAVACVIVVLYSPGLLALSPLSSNIITAGLSIIFFVILAFIIGYIDIYKPFFVPARRVEYHAVHDASDPNEVIDVLNQYTDNPIFNDISQKTIEQIHDAEEQNRKAHNLLDGRFTNGSLTNQTFTDTVDATSATIVKNAASISNIISICDSEEITELITDDGDIDDNEAMQCETYYDTLSRIKQISDANEKLLNETDKVLFSIADVSDDNQQATEEMISELQDMMHKLQMYKKAE